MTELEHLQKVILSIAKDIDRVCRENNIEYYLLGGSCIGAIRHEGFIPWDDDLDIIMTRPNYEKFLTIAKQQLDPEKYFVQEGLKDWPLYFSKIRLKGTYLHEPEDSYATEEMHGIYVDVFCLENVPDSNISARLQYFLAKYYLCYQLSQRKYVSASFKKKLMIALSFPLHFTPLRNAVVNYIEKFNKRSTDRLGFLYGRTKYRTSATSRKVYGKPRYVKFEDTTLPVPEKTHEYLTQMFGDYMKLPPENQRKGLHLLSVDFGKY
ncbi:MAG: LicD family protein [Bacteroidales bacterium]|nr:LicD family protein [Bacteroidales bacterium]